MRQTRRFPYTGSAAGARADPLVALRVDRDREHLLAREALAACEGRAQLSAREVHLVQSCGSADPERAARGLDGERAHVDRRSHLEGFDDLGTGLRMQRSRDGHRQAKQQAFHRIVRR
jgi:hypothetical protein